MSRVWKHISQANDFLFLLSSQTIWDKPTVYSAKRFDLSLVQALKEEEKEEGQKREALEQQVGEPLLVKPSC